MIMAKVYMAHSQMTTFNRLLALVLKFMINLKLIHRNSRATRTPRRDRSNTQELSRVTRWMVARATTRKATARKATEREPVSRYWSASASDIPTGLT